MSLDGVRERWFDALEDWACEILSSRQVRFSKASQRLLLCWRSAPLSVEVMVFDDWGVSLPAAFSFLQEELTGPVESIDEEDIGHELLTINWMVSGFSRDYGHTRAMLAMARWLTAFRNAGWSVVTSGARRGWGPEAWLVCQARWVHLSLNHQMEYDATFFLHVFENDECDVDVWRELNLREGFWHDVHQEGATLQYPRRHHHGQRVSDADALRQTAATVLDMLREQGWIPVLADAVERCACGDRLELELERGHQRLHMSCYVPKYGGRMVISDLRLTRAWTACWR